MPKQCDRCGKEMTSFTMSRFNTEKVCNVCEEREKKHPKYQEACNKELAECNAGNTNFPGIGCPPDLYVIQK